MMNRMEVLRIIADAEDRCLEAIKEADPRTAEFNNCFMNLGAARDMMERIYYSEPLAIENETKNPTIVPLPLTPIETPTTDHATDAPPAPTDLGPSDWPSAPPVTCSTELPGFDEVKHELKELQMSGHDVAAAIQTVGCAKLSEVPQEKYPELLALARGDGCAKS